jgi:hypothetical protein
VYEFSLSWTILTLSMPTSMFLRVTPTPVGKGAVRPSPPPALVPVHVRVRPGGDFHCHL